jgi:ribonuclease R
MGKRRKRGFLSKRKFTKDTVVCFVGILGKNRSGSGFVSLDLDDEKTHKQLGLLSPRDKEALIKRSEIFVPLTEMNTAMNGDLVEVEYHPYGREYRGKYGSVKKIIKRREGLLFGIYRNGLQKDYVELISIKYYEEPILIDESKNIPAGSLVRIELLTLPTSTGYAHAKVVDILDDTDLPARVIAIFESLGIKRDFNSAAQNEAKQISDIIPTEEIKRRRDLRNETIFTIDGADAKDFDDAIGIEVLKNGNYLLGVHIADVSYYVNSGSAIDKQAFARGTSIYIPNYVVPMLPFELSNGVCSLVEGSDRLTMSIEMEINKKITLNKN